MTRRRADTWIGMAVSRIGIVALVAGCTVGGASVAVPSSVASPAASPTQSAEPSAAADEQYGPARALFSFQDKQIVESSGVAMSLQDDRILFTHNDSGDRPRFFAVDDHGCTVARYSIAGATAADWEDMAHSRDTGGRGLLWFGDIGDNAASRDRVSVYSTPEPAVQPGRGGTCSAPKELVARGMRYDLVYPDGPHDAEALLADPLTSRLFIITKSTEESSVPTLYAAPQRLQPGVRNRMIKLTAVPIPARTSVPTTNPAGAFPLGAVPGKQVVTGADFAPDRSRVIVRTYSDAYEWHITNGDVARALAKPADLHVVLPGEPQGEAIGYTRDSRGFVVTSEDTVKSGPPVYEIERTQ